MGTLELSQTADLDLDDELARDVLSEIMRFRRSHTTHATCSPTCPDCQASHLAKVAAAIKAERPITFVLPAFPGKSPNLSKVLGTLPDMAERLALQFLEQLGTRIRTIYSPGAEIIICSDGRIFSDVVGMREDDVTEYQQDLDKMIIEVGRTSISTFNLDQEHEDLDFGQMREELMAEFGAPLDLLREKVVRGSKLSSHPDDEEALRMYLGITRFLVEDATFPDQTKSRTAIQKECKAKAYELIRRSNAWSEFLAERFPEAVRLSIHPQTCGSSKLGIRLVGTDSWMTPWHGVAVETASGFLLMKRSDAESRGAQTVYSADGRPSHFELRSEVEVSNN